MILSGRSDNHKFLAGVYNSLVKIVRKDLTNELKSGRSASPLLVIVGVMVGDQRPAPVDVARAVVAAKAIGVTAAGVVFAHGGRPLGWCL